ncbi:MAG: helix-turn-helix domain-containing protein [Bacteroidetes bacterium]|nr:helix-turn-helix domain-containing protein [Bacteroidota bacterium]
MTAFSFNSVVPHPLLRPYVAKMWVFESSGRLPDQERKLIVPNAHLKLTLTYRNGIEARVGDNPFLQRENELSLTGLIDTPVILNPFLDAETGTIIIEFNPLGAYRCFRLRYAEIRNQITDLSDLIGVRAVKLRSQLAEAGDAPRKLQILQEFLIGQLEKYEADPIYDHCIHRITATNGLTTVAQLEKETGYSARWLHRKFSEHLGTGAKNLAEILRFKQFYQAYSTGASQHCLKQHIYHYYYDQSHFLRAFRRYTGTTPTELQGSMNELSTKNFTS